MSVATQPTSVQPIARTAWLLERVLFALAGSMALLSALLAAVVSPWFLLLTAFVGINQWLYVVFGACPASLVLGRFGVAGFVSLVERDKEIAVAHSHDIITELREPTRELRKAVPDAWAGFAALHELALAAGAVPAHMKELVALAIAVAKQCEGCIAYHAKGAAMKGATRAEVAEVLAVALLMDGGPASVYGPRALAAFDEFAPAAGIAPAVGE